MNDQVRQARALGQSIWYDNISRDLLTSGELRRLVALGVSGLTSNPTIFQKAVATSAEYDDDLLALAQAHKNTQEIYEALAIADIQAAVDLLRPTYDETGGGDGYASLEPNPALAHDTEGTIAEVRRLFAALDRPNVMIKVPGTPEGIPAIRRLLSEGRNINVTLIFSVEAYHQIMEAYITGLEELAGRGGDISKVSSVASFFVSRVDTAVDALLEEHIRQGREDLKLLLGKAAVANAKLAYQAFKETFNDGRFAALRAQGARVQRPLWASTGTKNPAYSDLLYVEPLIGPDTVNTMPPHTLAALMQHGQVEGTLERDVAEARRTIEALEATGISMKQVTDKLLVDGVKAFADSFDALLADIEQKKEKLLAEERVHPHVG